MKQLDNEPIRCCWVLMMMMMRWWTTPIN